MKILTYNINLSLQEKIDKILGFDVDVFILPEVACKALGRETKATYYHKFKENSPFFLDYIFSNIPIKSYKLGEWDRMLSDHVPQFIEI